MKKRAEITTSLLVVIDMQDKLLKAISGNDELLEQTIRMTKYAKALQVPVLATEQYRRGLGESNAELRAEFSESDIFEKVTFNAFDAPEFAEALKKKKVETLVIAGVESHICVYQTVLEAINRGYQVRVLADAVGSRTEFNKQVGLNKMEKLGAEIDSTESVLYEWLKQAGTAEFKAVLPLVK